MGLNLTVAGIPLQLVKNTWGEDPPETLGEEVRMSEGTLASTERTGSRVFSGDIAFDTLAEGAAFRAAISIPASWGIPFAVIATSTADGVTGGASLLVSARLGRIQFVETRDDAGAWTAYWKARLTLRQTTT